MIRMQTVRVSDKQGRHRYLNHLETRTHIHYRPTTTDGWIFISLAPLVSFYSQTWQNDYLVTDADWSQIDWQIHWAKTTIHSSKDNRSIQLLNRNNDFFLSVIEGASQHAVIAQCYLQLVTTQTTRSSFFKLCFLVYLLLKNSLGYVEVKNLVRKHLWQHPCWSELCKVPDIWMTKMTHFSIEIWQTPNEGWLLIRCCRTSNSHQREVLHQCIASDLRRKAMNKLVCTLNLVSLL